MADSKNETAWNNLFEKYNILDSIDKEGRFIISSKNINEFREARLMTKFDHSFQLPTIFSDKKLSILPISRGEYIISNIKTFCRFPKNENVDIIDVEAPNYIKSLDYSSISSEATALNCAYVSGIITDFVEDEQLVPTVSGRMSSQQFSFDIGLNPPSEGKRIGVNVSNSQIEIDGGYEGLRSLSLIEAKNSLSSDFLIRQLYYPYRLWVNKVIKKVRPLFLTYTNGVFHFREYKFTELEYYNSIVLVREKKYRIKESSSLVINIQTIEELLAKTPIVKEPEIPFPQADSFERIINLCEIIHAEDLGHITKETLSSNYDFTERESFDARQIDYYTNAARYLGFIEKGTNEDGEIIYFLSVRGKEMFDLNVLDRQIRFVSSIISHKAFKDSLELYFKKAGILTKGEVVEIMKNSNLYKVDSETTFGRRASTITSWINWIINLIEE